MLAQHSPIFPRSRLTISPERSGRNFAQSITSTTLLPVLPDQPTAKSSSIEVYIIPTEKNLFVQGFNAHEYTSQPPTLLRGSLYLRVLKQCKIKSITLTLRGIQKTFWPDGIPPLRHSHWQSNDLITHSWPFYRSETSTCISDNGADCFVELNSKDETAHELPLHPNNSNLAEVFYPGDYIYNFEHPLPASIPETCDSEFGRTSYWLEVVVSRHRVFNPNLSGQIPITIVRTPLVENVRDSESVVITDDWKDQLRFEIVIGSKTFSLDSYLPLVFRFVPLFGKPAVHMIRVYLTQTMKYRYPPKNAKRSDPITKTMLLKYKAKHGHSLLSDTSNDYNYLPRELEFQMYVPQQFESSSYSKIHPDTSYENIQVKHTLRICLRLSTLDPINPGKRKYFEACMEAPVHVLSPLATSRHTLLPAYNDLVPPLVMDNIPHWIHERSGSSSSSIFEQTTSDNQVHTEAQETLGFHHLTTSEDSIGFERTTHLDANLYSPTKSSTLQSHISSPYMSTFEAPLGIPFRAVHLLRNPSFNPPPFDADISPPGIDYLPPPAYDGSYFEQQLVV
ncbi:uncharacterized protein SPAPADRAFT_49902 [Spathaspora passalidarum NRRL Y-27907]|uniref:Arrestin C-terminal-like domain-containing protein n=1 Tax=Spathaspora passalidarum (strain NRRL Y-27907 / 11-Y1) TaxID=619300 RepID=G3AKR8_SPAPN|nr:uncharacterized protein SPAPADRAFT_49902 [Spathaspora passalidarum NRRL Y-27907]EGW32972.1 hypothetical protein SPAPADRAFT_49902 [Spathaspora passalidarum NRRL Y-27907]